MNRVELVGRLTKDVEVRKTQSGLSVATFTVACDRRFSRDQQNNSQQTADFISCVAWRQTADFLGSYARKGALVSVEGRIQTRNYDDRDGRRVYVTEVVADDVRLLESRSQSQARAAESSSAPAYPSYQSYQPEVQNDPFAVGETGGADFNTGPSLDISSDDLPF